MSHRSPLHVAMVALCCALGLSSLNCGSNMESKDGGDAMSKEKILARGKYLMTVGGCEDCHSPKIMVNGHPVPDSTRSMSGHTAGSPLGAFDPGMFANGWAGMAFDGTAFVGPWGVSFAANLTPDQQTGIGSWTEEVFVASMRNGKHMGTGRPILPPMPWFNVAQMTNDDLSALFAYFQSLPPVNNAVPAPLPPEALATMGGAHGAAPGAKAPGAAH